MKFDACAFVGDSLYGNSVSPEELLAQMKQNGVERAVVRPFKPCDYNYDRANRYISEVQKAHPELIGFGRVNPLEKSAPQQVDALVSYGLRGLHLHPWEDNFIISDPKVYPAVEACGRHGLPVYVSTGYPCVSEPLQLWELAMKFPQVTFIATHGGQLDISGLSFDDAVYAAKSAKNLKFDLSGVYRRDFIELLIASAGEENVVFGSCAPYMDISLEIARVEAAQIPQMQKDKIFSENIRALLAM
ncbi:amidohydrolase family protein [Anaerotruncus rubiinfantis]|jgi:predicted TIM-barrel fold metal-dependent hydrolase|uniref:amidohydrolase family protein n=1 Tax=Anaerotruncus rubiinfantis TaxID=1720200 RepID=UPI001898BE59|nr:amidohydrolase family protein [Anaerotruncus rubiinfantis]